jgi:hypothetical protein
MKLVAQTYVSPLMNQGTFENVIIEDFSVTHKRLERYLAIGFEMYYVKNDQKIVLDTKEMGFLGMGGDAISSNKTSLISIPNPDYDVQVEGSELRITVPLFDYLQSHQGIMPPDCVIVDYGYPTYEKVMQYFSGGTLENPEITISAPLAIGFILTALVMNGEPVGTQFKMVEE